MKFNFPFIALSNNKDPEECVIILAIQLDGDFI